MWSRHVVPLARGEWLEGGPIEEPDGEPADEHDAEEHEDEGDVRLTFGVTAAAERTHRPDYPVSQRSGCARPRPRDRAPSRAPPPARRSRAACLRRAARRVRPSRPA